MMEAGSQLLAIVGRLAANPIKDKLQRNETIIKLLKEFGFEPDHPPADFSGIYAYTLVEYGVNKHKTTLELFRQSEIKNAFRRAFEQNNPSILLKEADDFLNWNILGDELRELEVDPRREFAAFATVFLEVVKRSRTPAEVRSDRKIDSLQRQVLERLDRIERHQTVSDVFLELASQIESSPLLTKANTARVKTFILEEQMRSWLTTLDYKFDRYQHRTERYFEWILLEETRRGYDRILVRGIEGEIGVGDINHLRQAVEEQKCEEGWLVTSRRISSAAKKYLKSKENEDLFCYTFDELIDEKVDFTPYFKWLEAEVKNKAIDRTYVPLACIKEEIDLATQAVIGKSHYTEEDGWIDGYIDRWLCDRSKEHISILGEFGTGKTWFTLHFAWTALQKYLDAKKRGVERPRLPIVIPLRDYAKSLDVGNVIAGFFFSKHNIRLTRAVFDRLNRMGKLLLIFDGFDEMADKVDRQKMINNFWELARVVTPGSKAILTCRTEHFPEAKEGRALLNAELKASTAALSGEPPQFEVLELEKFSESQIRQVLSFKTGEETVDKIMANSELLELASRPVMIDLIIEALPEIEAGKPIDISRVYLYAVRRKMERDIKSERTFTSLADKLYFMCELSWEMLSTDTMSLNYKLFPERIRRLFGSVVQKETDLDHWHYDMMGQTMLIRNADGDYTPAHRSLLEFFVAFKFAAELGILADDFIDVVRQQKNIDWSLPPQDYTWSGYFTKECDKNNKTKLIAPLNKFITENSNVLSKTIGKDDFSLNAKNNNVYSAILKLLEQVVYLKNAEVENKLLNFIPYKDNALLAKKYFLGKNTASILLIKNKSILKNRIFKSRQIDTINFSNANLANANMEKCDLSNSLFNKNTIVTNANLSYCNLSNIDFCDISYWDGHIVRLNKEATQHLYFNKIKHTHQFEKERFVDRHKITINFIENISKQENNVFVLSEKPLSMLSEFKPPVVNDVWSRQIQSSEIIYYLIDNNIVHVLTIENQIYSISLKTGSLLKLNVKDMFKKWKNANLLGVTGLDSRTAYLLKVFGAINVPEIYKKYDVQSLYGSIDGVFKLKN